MIHCERSLWLYTVLVPYFPDLNVNILEMKSDQDSYAQAKKAATEGVQAIMAMLFLLLKIFALW